LLLYWLHGLLVESLRLRQSSLLASLLRLQLH
jgi:hypothetical protein